MRAPVALFVYKRVEKTKQVLEALNNNSLANETDLYVFADGAKKKEDEEAVKQVRDIVKKFAQYTSFHSVKLVKADSNQGLANAIIKGVTEVINKYGKVIVVEDDLLTSNTFLEYMNDGLNFYENNLEIGSISGYSYPLEDLQQLSTDTYVLRKGECWGWATWNNRWMNVDWDVKDYKLFKYNFKRRKEFDSTQYGISRMLDKQMAGRTNSWAVRWCYHLMKAKQLTIYPKVSKTYNIGFDGDGTNCGTSDILKTKFESNQPHCKFTDVYVDKQLEKKIALFEKPKCMDMLKNIIVKRIKAGK